MFRRRRRAEQGPRVDFAGLPPRWRAPVEEALASRARFVDIVGRVPEGPLRERLEQLSTQVDEAVLACYETSSRAHAAEDTLGALDPDRLTAEVKDARRRLDAARDQGVDTSSLEQEFELLTNQHASVNRLWDGLDRASEQLRLLDLRLDGAVAQAAELALQPGTADLGRLDWAVDGLVQELEAVRSALDDVS